MRTTDGVFGWTSTRDARERGDEEQRKSATGSSKCHCEDERRRARTKSEKEHHLPVAAECASQRILHRDFPSEIAPATLARRHWAPARRAPPATPPPPPIACLLEAPYSGSTPPSIFLTALYFISSQLFLEKDERLEHIPL